jgi:3-hydroxyacyl-[acyl-carrier-protein] dehydratase
MRWTWIDRFVAFEPGKSAVAVKNLSLAEDHFADHFPGFPIMPAPLILEGLAQTGGILVGRACNFEKNVVLAKMNAKFHREAFGGEQLMYSVTLIDLNDTGARVSGTVTSGGAVIGEAEIMFGYVNPANLPPGLPDTQFVFGGELAYLMKLAEAAAANGGSG